MGMGFPTRPSRRALGPRFENMGTVTNAKKQIGEPQLNALFWQVTGAGVGGGLAWALIKGSDGSRLASGETWNPDGDALLMPAFSRTSAGVYVLTYAATYPDEKDAQVPISLFGAHPTPQTTSDLHAVALVTTARIVTIHVRDAAGTHADSDVLVRVY